MLNRTCEFSALILVLVLAGCSNKEIPVADGQRPDNFPNEMPDARPSQPVGTPEERAKKVAERLKEADEANKQKNYSKAIEELTSAIMIDPKDRKALLAMAKAQLAKGKAVAKTDPNDSYTLIISGAEYLRILRGYYPDETEEERNLGAELYIETATKQALAIRVQETTAALNDAIAAGFTDFDRIRDNPDWKQLLADPSFKKTWDPIDKKFPSKKK